MSKMKVYSTRKNMLTLHGEGGVRCVVKPGMNELDAEIWGEVKKHPSVAKMMEDKSLEEKGAVEKKEAPKAQPVADKKPEVKVEAKVEAKTEGKKEDKK